MFAPKMFEDFELSKHVNENVIKLFTNLRDVDNFIREFEDITDTKFVVCTKVKNFGSNVKPDGLTKNIFWESQKGGSIPISFNGNPLMFYGRKARGEYLKRSRTVRQESKKMGCKAKIHIQQILRFSSIIIVGKDRKSKEEGIKNLEDNFNEHIGCAEMEFYVKLPSLSDHNCFEVGEEEIGKRENIDDRVKLKIMELTCEGSTIDVVKKSVEDFVLNVLFYNKTPPSRNRRRYFPKRSDYFNLMRKTRKQQTEQNIIIETGEPPFDVALEQSRARCVSKLTTLQQFVVISQDLDTVRAVNDKLDAILSSLLCENFQNPLQPSRVSTSVSKLHQYDLTT
ncbi:uncharacterized protein LOC143462807 isoform X2 [Clavelina lepadiformis]|uniref:uncharacterized protein LOC143462807 isoform X2 n=1 Tax=Clavelina lepadiformis TaxID=159417 RepID=UPI004042450B